MRLCWKMYVLFYIFTGATYSNSVCYAVHCNVVIIVVIENCVGSIFSAINFHYNMILVFFPNLYTFATIFFFYMYLTPSTYGTYLWYVISLCFEFLKWHNKWFRWILFRLSLFLSFLWAISRLDHAIFFPFRGKKKCTFFRKLFF